MIHMKELFDQAPLQDLEGGAAIERFVEAEGVCFDCLSHFALEFASTNNDSIQQQINSLSARGIPDDAARTMAVATVFMQGFMAAVTYFNAHTPKEAA